MSAESDMSHCMHKYPQSTFESCTLQLQVKSRGRWPILDALSPGSFFLVSCNVCIICSFTAGAFMHWSILTPLSRLMDLGDLCDCSQLPLL